MLEDAGRSSVPFTTGDPDRHRRDVRGARRLALRDPRASPAPYHGDPGGDRPELPRQAGHRDARHARRRAGRAGRHGRGRPARAGPVRPHPGAAQPGRRRVRAAHRRRHRRLGRRLAADPRPRQPRAPLAADRRAGASAPPRPASSCANGSRVYPEYVQRGEPWLDPRLAAARDARWPTRRPAWPARTPSPRACRGRSPTRRFSRLRPHRPAPHHRHRPAAPPTAATTSTRSTATGRRCARPAAPAWCRPVRRGRPRRPRRRPPTTRPGSPTTQALALLHADGPALDALCRIADDVRRDVGRRRRHLRRHPQHQLHQRLLHRLPVLRLRPAPHRRRRLHPLPGAGRRPRRAGLGGRRHRGLHAGRHPPRPARHRLLRHRPRGEAARARHPRARLLADGGGQRRHPHRPVHPGLADRRQGGGPGHHPRHRRGDPRRRGALGPHQGQAAHRDLGRGRHHRPRAGHPLLVHDDVRPRGHAPPLARPPPAAARGSSSGPAASPSS